MNSWSHSVIARKSFRVRNELLSPLGPRNQHFTHDWGRTPTLNVHHWEICREGEIGLFVWESCANPYKHLTLDFDSLKLYLFSTKNITWLTVLYIVSWRTQDIIETTPTSDSRDEKLLEKNQTGNSLDWEESRERRWSPRGDNTKNTVLSASLMRALRTRTQSHNSSK